jgi:hypothetical protein
MSAAPARIWGHQARQILLLRERYATADLDAALGHAKDFGAFEFRAVERIIAARATPRPLDEYVAEQTVLRIVGALGETRTKPRDLTEYDRLPGANHNKEISSWPNETAPETSTRPPATIPSSKGSENTSNSSD